ncbi:MAG TPA: hypothetical protein VJ438_02545 [Candidatus Nanoarchaeia archaeon]|nr:hypothetical protein [Candidatus Nanoarchaeia archaeon]
MEDPEEIYIDGVEREGEIFLEGLQNKKSLAELEKQYSQKVKEIRRIYEKSLRKDINKEKEINEAKNNTKKPKEEVKEFRVENIKLNRNWKDKKQIEASFLIYKIKRKIKNFIQLITPDYFIYSYYKITRVTKDTFKEIKDIVERVLGKISKNISDILYYIKKGFIKIITDIKDIIDIFKIKNKKEKKEDGKKEPGKQTS